MEALKRIKKYKAERPEKTVTNIRAILCNKLGIILEEMNFKSEGGFYSTRIKIGNHHLSEMDLGTNGKGMTFAYSLASAHGEFMERLQNQAIMHVNGIASYKHSSFVKSHPDFLDFLLRNNVLLEYQYAPDEEYIKISTENIDSVFKNVVALNMDALHKKYIGKQLSMLPFYNITKGRIELLPYEVVFLNCTSNGMCAGNTPKEAIIQGLSEIIERYVLREIYTKGLSLPTIPDEYFNGTEILSKIRLLKEKYGANWSFLIKDCSLGKDYPAVGILMINRSEGKYLFHIGVDPSPITALERSLTEIFQGRIVATVLDIDFSIQNGIMTDPEIRDREFYKTCTTGSGHYPLSILNETSGKQFKGFDYSWGISDDTDLKKITKCIEDDGAQIFVRDVSFLGFPAFCIYVPGISEFRNTIIDNINSEDTQNKSMAMSAALDLFEASKEKIEALAQCVIDDHRYISDIMKFDPNSFLVRYDKSLIAGILYIASGNFVQAYRHNKTYCERFTGSIKEKYFFSALVDLLYCKIKNISLSTLSVIYDSVTIKSVDNFTRGKSVLEYVPYRSYCDNNWDDFVAMQPSFLGMLQVRKRLEDVYKNNIPSQEKIKKIFS